jgi:DNA-binding transcriptional regulator LsrR (DeoR family)
VGDIALRFFDENGQPIISDLNDRVVGITLDQLQKIDEVVAVTGGPEKVLAIRGALRGGYLDVLITDQATAKTLISDEVE